MKKLSCFFLVFFMFFSWSNLNANTQKSFDTIVAFGDSLTDDGNLYRYLLHFLPVSPPYYEGHFSNGQVWLEKLYSHLFPEDYKDGFQNYAVGGAGAVLARKENLPFTLTAELDDYLYWNTYEHKDTTLYVIWIGGNNYINGPTKVDSLTTSATDAIITTVERLIGYGGNKFLIANLPNLANTPAAVEASSQNLLGQLSEAHNQKLLDKFNQLKAKYPELTFIFFDVDAQFNDVKNNPERYDITDTDSPCYLGSYSGWFAPEAMLKPSQQALSDYLDEQLQTKSSFVFNQTLKQTILQSPQLTEALRVSYTHDLARQFKALKSKPIECQQHMFWDHLHPTTQVHQILANKVAKLIAQAGLSPFVAE